MTVPAWPGTCGGVLLRKLADQCGLTAALEAALTRVGTFPQLSRGMVVVSMAVAIALGATSRQHRTHPTPLPGQAAPLPGRRRPDQHRHKRGK
jgi:hypothetical protein